MPIWARQNLFLQTPLNLMYKLSFITDASNYVDKWIYVTVFVAKNLTTTLDHKYIPPIWLLEQPSYCYVMALISSFVTTSRVYLYLLPVLLLVCRLEIVSFLKKIRPRFCSKRYNKGVKLTLYLHSCPPVVSLV